MKVAVTGGVGFIGSHLVDWLVVNTNHVTVIDNLSSGKLENLNKKAHFIKKDIRQDISSDLTGTHTLFHFAETSEALAFSLDPSKSFDINVIGTFNVLEACRKADVTRFVFASSHMVYGDPQTIPTPECQQCVPTTTYSASKLACEAYVASYCNTYGLKGSSLRFASIFGERSARGPIYNICCKLKNNPNEISIPGDGKQDGYYLHVSDAVFGITTAWKKQKLQYDVFNICSKEKITTNQIVRALCKHMKLDPIFRHAGFDSEENKDCRSVSASLLLDTKKLESLGWVQANSFRESIGPYIARMLASDKSEH